MGLQLEATVNGMRNDIQSLITFIQMAQASPMPPPVSVTPFTFTKEVRL